MHNISTIWGVNAHQVILRFDPIWPPWSSLMYKFIFFILHLRHAFVWTGTLHSFLQPRLMISCITLVPYGVLMHIKQFCDLIQYGRFVALEVEVHFTTLYVRHAFMWTTVSKPSLNWNQVNCSTTVTQHLLLMHVEQFCDSIQYGRPVARLPSVIHCLLSVS